MKQQNVITYKLRKYLSYQCVTPCGNKRERAHMLPLSGHMHLVFFPLSLLYFEILLRLLDGTGLFKHLIYPILFGLSLGLLLSALTSLFSADINNILTKVIIILIEVVFVVECLVKKTFGTYMTPGSIRTGAGHVVTGYSGLLLSVIMGGLVTIVLFSLPLILYFLFGSKMIFPRKYKVSISVPLLAGSAIFFAAGIAAVWIGHTRLLYTSQYNFNTSVETFGLVTGLRLNIKYHDTSKAFILEEELTADADEEQEEQMTSEQEQALADQAKHSGYNEMNIDFTALSAPDATIAEMNQYVSTLSPTNKNEYTGLFEGKNLIMICAEAFSDAVISQELTPTLYRLTHNGFYFSDYYQPAWGGSTITGEMSMLLGLAPLHEVETISETIGENMYFTMGNQLQRLGYYNGAYHNGEYNYYDRQLTHENFGYATWIGSGNGLEEICGWEYPSDADTFDKTMDLYINCQPFSVYYMTLSGHCEYDSSSEFVTEERMNKIRSIFGDRYQDTTMYYLCYQMVLEDAMQIMVSRLEAAGISDDTVICLTGDHYPYGLAMDETFNNDEDYIENLYGSEYTYPWQQDHNTLIIWSGCLENENKDMAVEISTPASSLDILPTLSNLFNLQYESRLLPGRDVFSDADPLVMWIDYSWVTEQGKYDGSSGIFYPNDGYSTDQNYISKIRNIVSNKLTYSGRVLSEDYFTYLFGPDNDTQGGGAFPSSLAEAQNFAAMLESQANSESMTESLTISGEISLAGFPVDQALEETTVPAPTSS